MKLSRRRALQAKPAVWPVRVAYQRYVSRPDAPIRRRAWGVIRSGGISIKPLGGRPNKPRP